MRPIDADRLLDAIAAEQYNLDTSTETGEREFNILAGVCNMVNNAPTLESKERKRKVGKCKYSDDIICIEDKCTGCSCQRAVDSYISRLAGK